MTNEPRPAFRGGGWRHAAGVCQMTNRFKSNTDERYIDVSFRVIRVLSPIQQIAEVNNDE